MRVNSETSNFSRFEPVHLVNYNNYNYIGLLRDANNGRRCTR